MSTAENIQGFTEAIADSIASSMTEKYYLKTVMALTTPHSLAKGLYGESIVAALKECSKKYKEIGSYYFCDIDDLILKIEFFPNKSNEDSLHIRNKKRAKQILNYLF